MNITDIKPGNLIQKSSNQNVNSEVFLVTKVCEDFIWVIDQNFVFNKIYSKFDKYRLNSLDDYELFSDYSNVWKERVNS